MVPPLLLSRSDAQSGGYRDLSPLAALHHLGDVRLVDVREADEFVGPLGHVPGAELVPLSTVTAAAADWDRDQPVLLICRSGARSARAAIALAGMGFQSLYNLVGGMLAWEVNALPRLRGDDTPLAQVAGQIQACFIATAGADTEIGKSAFAAALGPSAGTPDGLRRALRALPAAGTASAEECAGWVERLQQRLAEVE
ncbi:MAG: rhodanese-like domain-containing protein [Pseudomonadota bacterium]|nr:rhodanese-like domain-containing protein [Pseudomonadota bacterium]